MNVSRTHAMLEYFSHHPVAELSTLILIIIVVVGLTRMFRQPTIIGYIIAGILVSPAGLNLVTNQEGLEIFAELGIAILLFMVGLGLNPKIVKKLGKVSIIAGTAQILITFFLGRGIAAFMGFELITSIYIAIAMTFSSTIVIVKLLQDSKESGRLYAKLAIGILIMQDIAAIIVLMIVGSLSGEGANLEWLPFLGIFVAKVTVSLSIVYAIARWVLPRIMEKVAQSQEYLLLFSLGRTLVLGTMFTLLGFSLEIGALLAGVALATSPYRHQINSKLRSLRDFFVAMFFLFLGLTTSFTGIGEFWVEILVLSIFVLVIQPLLIMSILGFLGYTKKNSFLAGITMAQISEFGFIIIALGLASGHIQDPRIVSMVIVIGLISIAGSSYFYASHEKLYKKMAPSLGFLEKRGRKKDAESRKELGYSTIVYGFNRIGKHVVKTLQKLDEHFLVIDFNPSTIDELERKNIPSLYGDATDDDLLEEINVGKLKNVIVSISEFEPNLAVLYYMKKHHAHANLIVVANTVDDAKILYEAGADYVIMPHFLGSTNASDLLEQFVEDESVYHSWREKHLKELQNMDKS